MKSKFFILLITTTFILLFGVSANEIKTTSKLDLIELNQEEKEEIIDALRVTLITSPPSKKAIKIFDINERNSLAVGTEDGTISVYDSNGNFKYGYKIEVLGSYGFEWDKENLIIYLVRSSIAVSYDSNCQIKSVAKYEDNVNNSTYLQNTIFATEKNINKSKYTMKNDMGILNLFVLNYSKIECVDIHGEEKIIYDAENSVEKVAIWIFVFILLILVSTIIVIKRIWNNRQGTVRNH